ncbi:MAG TPA: iron-containing redox enzyme family protein [Chitinophaga sp.]|uniref:iron-containing redox enzyme family protein n=1 Tax=Chitinophaga sp. TaxID=1869181 RepID=UPI002D119F81|nr:iron-containing redox enzyme family protein [Chitinophaga sp.]HVI49273.1 iron-containing redox enzyme family protein [Chitinophaga sp.]
MKTDSMITASNPTSYDSLHEFQTTHSFWNNDLFNACRRGWLTKEDFKYIFSQYYLYCKNFTRYITGVMTNCEDDLQRANLSENLWEEAGEKEPEKRHAEIFRKFLKEVLEIDLKAIKFEPFTYQFVNSYLKESQRPDIVHGTAFLSLGTEGIVAEMYKQFIEGMLKAGIHDSDLLFFHLHVECDDDHALTLENMLMSYQHQPNWFETAKTAVDIALNLRYDFFNNLYKALYLNKITPVINGIIDGQSLAANTTQLHYERKHDKIYQNKEDENNIEFSVDRIALSGQVLDPRIVHIPSGKQNENHSHAHETYIYIIQGNGTVKIDDMEFPVSAGSSILVPRWSRHQTSNTSENEELIFLGVTDFNLTKNFPGNTETSYRKSAKA